MKSVVVEAPARLHLGFIDLSGSLSRKFGSLGVAVSGISTRLTFRPGTQLDVGNGPESERVAQYQQMIMKHFGWTNGSQITIDEHIPSHAGLGSGTQLALAVGRGISALYGQPISTAEIAEITKRGARSGIGIGVFESGGFVVDLGRGPETVLPPELCRLEFPSEWAVVLVHDHYHCGISGNSEASAFQKMTPMKPSMAAALSHHTLMGIIPSVIERDFSQYVRSLEFIQNGIGEYFAPYQGGRPFTSERVASMIERIKTKYPELGSGQSSWGPTGFVFCPNMAQARELLSYCENELTPAVDYDGLRCSIHEPRNHGATITHLDVPG